LIATVPVPVNDASGTGTNVNSLSAIVPPPTSGGVSIESAVCATST